MGCCPCFSSQKSPKDRTSTFKTHQSKSKLAAANNVDEHDDQIEIKSHNFNFRELAAATKNFRQECLLGQGGFGRVYRGTLQGTGKVVAIKQIDKNGLQHGSKEFLAEVAALSLIDHENLVKLVGYCADGDQRLLVYEFISGGSLDDCLFDIGPEKEGLDWCARMKLAFGAAKGLEYLHDKAEPPIIYGNMKSTNILLDGDDLNPKLSDFGMANIGPNNDKFHGYSAPEYTGTNNMTQKSDVYSFGVILLELISGRRAIDATKPLNEQNLVSWAQPKFRDPKMFPQLADPLLRNKFHEKSLNQAVAVAAMCLQAEASVRPLMADIVTTLSFLLAAPDITQPPPPSNVSPSSASRSSSGENHGSDGTSSDSEDSNSTGGSGSDSCSSRQSSMSTTTGRGQSQKRVFSRKSKASTSSKGSTSSVVSASDETNSSSMVRNGKGSVDSSKDFKVE